MPEATLALVGDGPAREKLKRHFQGTRTRFLGYYRGERLASAFASADALLFPSRTETLGLVLLEAMAAGCPVVAARAGGIPDIVTDGVNGCLFDPADPDGLTRATRRLFDSASYRERLHRNARLEAEQWSWAAATDALRSYYQAVLTGEPIAPTSHREPTVPPAHSGP
jgi:glycosyltransferase involved in cell wall biosynthesis